MKTKMNYTLREDGIYSNIEMTTAPANSYDTYATFSEAKKALIEKCEDNMREWKEALKYARTLKKSDNYMTR